MSCPNETRIDDLVDGTLAAADRVALEHHLDSCASCRALAADFRTLRAVAATLDRPLPSPQAWSRIEAAVAADAARPAWAALWDQVRHGAWRHPGVASPLVTAAFAVIVAALVWTTWTPANREAATTTGAERAAAQGGGTNEDTAGIGGTSPGAGRATGLSAGVSAGISPGGDDTADGEQALAEGHYQDAIDGLEAITTGQASGLDPQMTATLTTNLAVIDQAIDESRMALASQPSSLAAQASLVDALRNKVALLEDTVSLINGLRDDDPGDAFEEARPLGPGRQP